MYYKVLKDNKVIDVLDHLSFVKYQEKHGLMVPCTQAEAHAVLSSDGEYIRHAHELYHLPVAGYGTVEIIPIDQYEYKQLSMFNLTTPEAIIDAYTKSLLDGGIL